MPSRPPRPLLVVLVTLALLTGCSSVAGTVEAGAELPLGALEEEPGLAHVHGIDTDPADGSLLIATHFGLWRIAEGADEAERVGRIRHDLMGFSVVGPDHFVASGHPILSEDLPALLGLIETRDGGRSWRSVSLLGEVDFHALRAVHGRYYGWDSASGRLLVSLDGEVWEERSTVPALVDLVVDPAEPDQMVVTRATDSGLALAHSRDGGRTFETVDSDVELLRLAWDDGALWGSDTTGALWRSSDAGGPWSYAGRSGLVAEALHAQGEVVVAAQGGVVRRSSDGGATWSTAHADPAPRG